MSSSVWALNYQPVQTGEQEQRDKLSALEDS